MVKTHIITNHVSENNLALKVHELPKRSCSMHPKRFQGSGSVSLSWLTGTLDSICANVCQMLGGKEMFDYVMLWGDWTLRPYLSCCGYRKCSSVPFPTASKIKITKENRTVCHQPSDPLHPNIPLGYSTRKAFWDYPWLSTFQTPCL